MVIYCEAHFGACSGVRFAIPAELYAASSQQAEPGTFKFNMGC